MLRFGLLIFYSWVFVFWEFSLYLRGLGVQIMSLQVYMVIVKFDFVLGVVSLYCFIFLFKYFNVFIQKFEYEVDEFIEIFMSVDDSY